MRTVARAVLPVIAAFVVGCSTDSTAPSSTAASIAGTVRSSSGNGPNSSVALKVVVSGTGVATMTKPNGQFNLNDVPPGNVTLLFEGSGVNARLPLGTLRAGDRVTIVVTVNGSTAMLNSRDDAHDDGDDDDDDDNEVEGRISGLGGDCPIRTFKIGNTSVKTGPNTKYEGVACGTLANDMQVEAEGTFTNSVLDATKIERD